MHSCAVRKTSMENVKVFALIDIDRGEPGFLTVGNTVGHILERFLDQHYL